MKTIKIISLFFLSFLVVTSCELDNYDFPESSIHGVLIDQETGEQVQSDIYDGSKIALIEIDANYENPQKKYLIFNTDGSYQNDMMFDGLYSVPSIENGNFQATDSTSVTVDGDTEFNLNVTPYIRLTDVEYIMDGMDLTVNFKLESTMPDTIHIMYAKVFAHTDPYVGNPHRLDDEDMYLDLTPVPDQIYTIEWDISRSRVLDEDVKYYFRVGAIIDVPGAKYNYAAAERLTPTKGK